MNVNRFEPAADRIVDVVGLDMSYFTHEQERHLDHLTVELGLTLLGWFLEGVGDAVGIRSRLRAFGKSLTHRLDEMITNLQDRDPAKNRADLLSGLDESRRRLARFPQEEIVTAGEQTARVLVTYMVDELGMPRSVAQRIGEHVQSEAVSATSDFT